MRYKSKLKYNPHNYKTLKRYHEDVLTKEEIRKIFEFLQDNEDHHKIHEGMPHISKRQIKLIRWILTYGDDDLREKMFSGKYILSRLKRNFTLKKKIYQFVYLMLFTDKFDFTKRMDRDTFKKNRMLYHRGILNIKTYVKAIMLENNA